MLEPVSLIHTTSCCAGDQVAIFTTELVNSVYTFAFPFDVVFKKKDHQIYGRRMKTGGFSISMLQLGRGVGQELQRSHA